MSDEYSNTTNGIGVCRLCNDRSELFGSDEGFICNTCREKKRDAKLAPTQTPNNGTFDSPDGFDAWKADYMVIKGKRYELNAVSKKRCTHKIMSWLNEGPKKFKFCPDCGSQVLHDERKRPSEEGDNVAEHKSTEDLLPESPRTSDADEGVAGLHGSDELDSVGDRTEASGRNGGAVKITDPLAEPIKKSGKRNPRKRKTK